MALQAIPRLRLQGSGSAPELEFVGAWLEESTFLLDGAMQYFLDAIGSHDPEGPHAKARINSGISMQAPPHLAAERRLPIS